VSSRVCVFARMMRTVDKVECTAWCVGACVVACVVACCRRMMIVVDGWNLNVTACVVVCVL